MSRDQKKEPHLHSTISDIPLCCILGCIGTDLIGTFYKTPTNHLVDFLTLTLKLHREKKKKTSSITEKFVATIAILLTRKSGAYQRLLTLKYFLWSMPKQNASMRHSGKMTAHAPLLSRVSSSSVRMAYGSCTTT